MNFFKLYIGDYMRDTGTLSVPEHGAYLLMLMHLYATEKPLPQGKELHRLLRAETKADREATDAVAAKFFYVAEGGLYNRRADEEIVKAEHVAETNRQIALGREAKKRARKEHEPSTKRAPVVHEQSTNQNQTPYSVANATGGEPPPVEDGTMTKAELWASAKSLLAQQGMPAAQCGSFVGALAKQYPAAIEDAVRSAVLHQPADAASYLKATCMRLKGDRKDPVTVPSKAAEETAAYLAQRSEHIAQATPPPAAVLALRSRRPSPESEAA